MIVTRREGGSESGHERYTNAHAALDCSGESCSQRPSPCRGKLLGKLKFV